MANTFVRAPYQDAIDTQLHGIVRPLPTTILSINAGNSDLIDVASFAYWFKGLRKIFPGAVGFDPSPSSSFTPSGSLYLDSAGALVVRETGQYSPSLSADRVHLGLYVYPGAAGPGPAQPLYAVATIAEAARPYGQALDRAFSFGPQFFEGSGRVTKNGSGVNRLDVAAGTGFSLFGEMVSFIGGSAVTFRPTYRSATPGVWTFASPTTSVPTTYDDGDGTPAAIPVGRFATHTLVCELGLLTATGGVDGYFMILGQATDGTTAAALDRVKTSGLNLGPFQGSTLATPIAAIVMDVLGTLWTTYDARRRLGPTFAQTG